MNNFKSIFSLVILFLLLWNSNLFSATKTALSCSQSDIQSAIDLSKDGDTVIVPPGTCAWKTKAAYTACISWADKAIILIAKQPNIIIDSAGSGSSGAVLRDENLISVIGKNGHPFRISGFNFQCLGNNHSRTWPVISIAGTCTNFRIDHCTIKNITGKSFYIDWSYGLIDHCIIDCNEGTGFYIIRPRPNISEPIEGDSSWREPMTWGTANAVYIEDCRLIWHTYSDGGIDLSRGGRAVVRNSYIEGIMLGGHGYDSSPRSALQMELYNNTFASPNYTSYWGIQMRGGSAVVFNNIMTGRFTMPFGVTNYRSCDSANAQWVSIADKGICDGNNVNDGNTLPKETNMGWPCKDQIGRGSNQSSEPVYQWNNTCNDIIIHIETYGVGTGDCKGPTVQFHIKPNRDYFDGVKKPNYQSFRYPHPLAIDSYTKGLKGLRISH